MSEHELRYPNIVRAVLETPWAMLESHFHAMIEILSIHVAGDRLSPEELAARTAGRQNRRDATRSGDTALIPIYGAIIPRADAMTAMSGGTPLTRFQSDLAAAVRDPDVANILLDIDSPGGQTGLVQEAAADIRAASKVKPVVASANPLAASAAYWLGTAASEFVATPSARVGSIGVFAAHEDVSKALEMKGISTTLVSAGKYKTETSGLGPLSDEARDYVQSLVDESYQAFTGDVARYRGVSVDTVRGGFAEGRMVSAKNGAKLGMIDTVEPIGATLRRLAAGGSITTPEEPAGDPAPDVVVGQAPGLSFAANLRHTLGVMEELTATAHGFADVRQKGSLTAAKREQLVAAVDALGELDKARSDIVALLEETDPERPRKLDAMVVDAYLAGRALEKGIA